MRPRQHCDLQPLSWHGNTTNADIHIRAHVLKTYGCTCAALCRDFTCFYSQGDNQSDSYGSLGSDFMDELLLRDVSGVCTSVLMFQWYTFAKNVPFHFSPKGSTEWDADGLSYQMCIWKVVGWPGSNVPDQQDYQHGLWHLNGVLLITSSLISVEKTSPNLLHHRQQTAQLIPDRIKPWTQLFTPELHHLESRF